MPIAGRVEILSTEFASGWALARPDAPHYFRASLDGKTLGVASAVLARRDNEQRRAQGKPDAATFLILFDRSVPAHRVKQIEIREVQTGAAFPPAARPPRIDRAPPLRIFLLGSPRSGTSKLGQSIVDAARIAWTGEGHVAPIFMEAARLLAGDAQSPNGLVRFLAEQSMSGVAIAAMKTAYFMLHGSASFLDKTPAEPMVAAAPFLAGVFPDAKFIYLQRNGVSNLLSRMEKFGGDFTGHCLGWAGTVRRWREIRDLLPRYLELRQEDMLEEPAEVSRRVADFLGLPEIAGALGQSLEHVDFERTGSGIGRTRLAETGWSDSRIAEFRRICGPVMEECGDQLD